MNSLSNKKQQLLKSQVYLLYEEYSYEVTLKHETNLFLPLSKKINTHHAVQTYH